MLQIKLADSRNFRPGEVISGTAVWQFAGPPRSVEVRLCWSTSGKGNSDADVVETQSFSTPSDGERRPFQFRAPSEPYSFSGKLISLTWAVELVSERPDEVEREEIVIAPEGRTVELPTFEKPPAKTGFAALSSGGQ